MAKATHGDVLELPREERNVRLAADLRDAVAELEPLVLDSQDAQAEILEFRRDYERLPSDAPLAPKTLRRVHRGTRHYLDLQENLADLAGRYAPLARVKTSALESHGIDPSLRAKAVAVSLAAAVTLYDNHLSLLTILKDERLRRLAYSPDRGYGMAEDEFEDFVDSLNAPEKHRRLHDLADRWIRLQDAGVEESDDALALLDKVIQSSVSFRHARDSTLGRALPSQFSTRRAWFLDKVDALAESALGSVSEIFGNGIGMVEIRKGKLWKDSPVRKHLEGVLQPLDLLLEKTPFRLTDWFIPGHFGHVAIWMGTYAELNDLRIWGATGMPTERVEADQDALRAGRSVLEALRPGVVLHTLEHFLNVDDVAVLRPTYLTEPQRRESLVRAFRQIGKDYDFGFDVETTGEIVCSELPYHVYPDVPWTTEQQLGRFTISPDDIASLAFGEHALFEILVFYHDGRRVPDAEVSRRMTELMA